MKKVLVIVSLVGLCLTVIPSFMVMFGKITWESHSNLMILGMILWFCSSPFWVKKST